MKSKRIVFALLGLASIVGLAYVAQRTEDPSGAKMVSAAKEFVGTLKDEQKKKAIFDFDSKERTNWNFIPLQDAKRNSTRKGLPLEDMTADQKKLALALVRSGTSKLGAEAAESIMQLESILAEQEKDKGPVRKADWYFFTIFGTPSKSEKWGWRVEGHHLSLNFTMDGTDVVASTPAFFGANPAEVTTGSKKGTRVLAASEDLAAKLVAALSDDQKKQALQAKPFGEPGQKTLKPGLGKPVGVAAADLTKDQKDALLKLVETYTSRQAPDLAAEEWKKVMSGGVDKIHFAYSGSFEKGKGHTYRVHGPEFVIEYLNIQGDAVGNSANHQHTAYRRIEGDFGIK